MKVSEKKEEKLSPASQVFSFSDIFNLNEVSNLANNALDYFEILIRKIDLILFLLFC